MKIINAKLMIIVIGLLSIIAGTAEYYYKGSLEEKAKSQRFRDEVKGYWKAELKQ